jgi:methylenetetrahydrofolate dehydrogenase (NADP+)/methenyltetrahydrofolate cyclohydrolase
MLTATLNGKALGQQWLAQVAVRVQSWPRAPRVVIVQVGNNPASTVYVGKKLEAATTVGIIAERVQLRAEEGEAALHSLLHGLAQDDATDAVLVQTPLPAGWDVQQALDAVPWRKDVDGLSTASAARRAAGLPCHWPATPAAVLRLLTEEWGHTLPNLPIAVIGNGRVVGAPLRQLLAQMGAEVIAINRDTPHPQALCQTARVVVAACGVPGLVNEHWLQQGADVAPDVIDVGLTPEENTEGKKILRGDVDALRIEGLAARRTPAPGGVGPLTVAQLLTNVVGVQELPSS